MEWLSDPQIWASFVTLTALEIVLGIDNLVFIAIVAGRLPPERQNRARQVGLALALITRLALLASIVWIIGLTRPMFDLSASPFLGGISYRADRRRPLPALQRHRWADKLCPRGRADHVARHRLFAGQRDYPRRRPIRCGSWRPRSLSPPRSCSWHQSPLPVSSSEIRR